MPERTCHCGGAGWDGCTPNRNSAHAVQHLRDLRLHEELGSRLEQASREGGRATLRQLLSRPREDGSEAAARLRLPAGSRVSLDSLLTRRSSDAEI